MPQTHSSVQEQTPSAPSFSPRGITLEVAQEAYRETGSFVRAGKKLGVSSATIRYWIRKGGGDTSRDRADGGEKPGSPFSPRSTGRREENHGGTTGKTTVSPGSGEETDSIDPDLLDILVEESRASWKKMVGTEVEDAAVRWIEGKSWEAPGWEWWEQGTCLRARNEELGLSLDPLGFQLLLLGESVSCPIPELREVADKLGLNLRVALRLSQAANTFPGDPRATQLRVTWWDAVGEVKVELGESPAPK